MQRLRRPSFGCASLTEFHAAPSAPWSNSTSTTRLPTPDSRLPTPDSRLPTPDSRLPTPDSRLPTPDSRLPTPDSRLPTPDSRGSGVRCCLMKIGYQGEGRSYSDRAVNELFPDGEHCGFTSFAFAFHALRDEDVSRLVLPIENSTTGSVLPVLDRLTTSRARIVGEHLVEVRHALIGVPGATVDQIKTVRSHPPGSGPGGRPYRAGRLASYSDPRHRRRGSFVGRAS